MSQSELREDLYCPECANKGMRTTADKTESGRTRYRCPSCGFRTVKVIYTKPQILPKTRVTEIKRKRRFLITSAVNDTPVVADAHKTWLKIARELNACYLVIPGVYKNPDLKHQGIIKQYTWPKEILPYICNVDIELNENLVIRGETRIQYTAINPLEGMNHAGDMKSEIYGHPQVAMEMVATPHNHYPKMLHTTGSVSAPNYGGSKKAKKAEFHHSISALFIEVEGKKFWTHEVHFDGTGAHLFDKYYSPGRKVNGKVAGMLDGDTHIKRLRPKTKELLSEIAKAVKPEHRVLQDVHDHYIGSHHAEGKVLSSLTRVYNKDFSIRKELMLSIDFLEEIENVTIVDSNHHRHLDQWFNRFNPRGSDLINLDLYFELGSLACKDIKKGGDGNLFRLFVEKYCKNKVRFIGGNDDFDIRGIDCSQHGDIGPNGVKGSARTFSKTGRKTVIGHGHTPGIFKGCYQIGASEDRAHFAVGYSSWMSTHCFIYDNGKRGLFSIIDDKLSPLMRELIK